MNEFRSMADAYWVRDGDTVEFDVEQAPKGAKGCRCRRAGGRVVSLRRFGAALITSAGAQRLSEGRSR